MKLNQMKRSVISLIFLIISLISGTTIIAQTTGCTDPQSINFDPSAIQNDGSCEYPLSNSIPRVICELPMEVNETSSLIFLKNKVWTLNDSGNEAAIYVLDTLTGQVLQKVILENTTNVDWEELCFDNEYLYVGDFGNNAGMRTDLCIYKVLVENLPDEGNASVTAEKISFSYPDQTSFDFSKTHNFDCEAFISSGDSLYLFTKNRGDSQTKIYRLPKETGSWKADYVTVFNARGLITGADFNTQKNELILVGYGANYLMPYVWIMFGFDGNDFFGANKRRIDFTAYPAAQMEGITYLHGKQILISAERSLAYAARFYHFSTVDYTDKNISNADARRAKKAIIHISEQLTDTLKMSVSNLPKGTYRVDISNLNEKVILSFSADFAKNEEKELNLSIADLPSDMYLVTFIGERAVVRQKFMKP
jgi:hypothetical protein